MKKEILNQMITDGLISKKKHPSANLYIYNYTPKVQYEKIWNETTLQTRGLILEENMNVVSKPFGKFFNIEELQPEEIPKLSFDVFEKMDGSLGILYWINNTPYIATRGSFNSEQAINATKILHSKYRHLWNKLDKNKTYLFEIIYPENRIVIDYGKLNDLILLTVIDNNTSIETLPEIGFKTVKKIKANSIYELKAKEENNKEGFVVRFENGFRIKVKFAEYFRLHKIITGISNVTVWQYLYDGLDFTSILENVPDEFYNWIKQTKSNLENEFDSVLSECKSVFKKLETRKDTALYFKNQKHPAVLFNMLDKKDINQIIWKVIKPKFNKSFTNNIDC